jgi:hypothetical protein
MAIARCTAVGQYAGLAFPKSIQGEEAHSGSHGRPLFVCYEKRNFPGRSAFVSYIRCKIGNLQVLYPEVDR